MYLEITVWSEKESCWLRFYKNSPMNPFLVEKAVCEQGVTKDWVEEKEGTWTVDAEAFEKEDNNEDEDEDEDEEAPINQSYHLHEGILYRNDWKTQFGPQISKFVNDRWVRYTGQERRTYNPFPQENQEERSPLTRPLPLTPEALKAIKAIKYTRFIGERDDLRYEAIANHLITHAQINLFRDTLTEAWDLHFQSRMAEAKDSPETIHLSFLNEILSNPEHPLRKIAINSFNAEMVGLSSTGCFIIAMNDQQIENLRQNIRLHSFSNHHAFIRNQDNGLYYYFDQREVTQIEENFLIDFQRQGLNRLKNEEITINPRLLSGEPLSWVSLATGKPELKSGGILPHVRELEKKCYLEMLEAERTALTRLIKPNEPHADEPHADEPHADEPHADEPHADEPHFEPDNLTKIKQAISSAQANYACYYAGTQLRGPNGWFSFLRHGKTGQNNALRFNDHIQKVETVSDAQEFINAHLSSPKTRYNRHSFASFLLDELSGIPDSPWSNRHPDALTNLYQKI